MDDTLKALKEDMLAFIDPGVAENDIEHTVSVEHHNFLRWFDALDRLSAQQREPVVRVKVKPLVWRDHRPDSFPEPAWSAQTSFGFYNIEEVSASDSPAYVVRLHAHHFVADKDSLDEAKAAAQADYEARIKSALITAPPADAGMREALEIAHGKFCLIAGTEAWTDNCLDGWRRSPGALREYAEQAAKEIDTALTAPGATTKSDGDEPSSRTAGGFPVAAAPYHAEETGVIQPTRERAGIERGMDQGVTGGESATTNSSPSEPKNYFFENEEDAAEAADNGRNTGGKSYYRPSDPSSTRSGVTVEIKHLISSARAFLAHFNPCDLAEDKSQQWQSLEHQCNRVERALLDQFEIRRRK